MHELSGAFNRHHAISVECLSGVQPSCFLFGAQMWRNEANSVDGWPSMRDSHDLVPVQMVFHSPPSPMALDALGRVYQDTVEIKQNRIAFEMRHKRRVTITTAELEGDRSVYPAA